MSPMRHCLYGSSKPRKRSFGRFSRPLLEGYFSNQIEARSKGKSRAVAEIFRYCKGFFGHIAPFCLLDQKYKRGLLSQLIAQKKAFNTSREWKTVKLGHIFKERTERAKGNETLLAVTISNGVQRRDEIDLKDNSSDDKSNYKCVYIGDIAYNTMRMWQGASGVSPYNGIVSPAYTIVTPIRPDAHNMTFWAYYFKYSPLVQTFQKYSQGLTSDTWNLKFPQFSEITVTMPSKYEQDKIAECLSVFDEHCKCEEGKLQVLFQVRTSLLQQLFI